MADFDFDAVVVGAGAVGLACGYALSRRGLVVAVLEANAIIGEGVSARYSEVVHGGIYYPTGSLMDRDFLLEVVEIARAAGAWILCDEVYRGTDQTGNGMTASIADLYEKGISTGSMSKESFAGTPTPFDHPTACSTSRACLRSSS